MNTETTVPPSLPALREVLTESARRMMLHALGLDRKRIAYRNAFHAVVGQPNYAEWEDLVNVGFATIRCDGARDSSGQSGDGDRQRCFQVTMEGVLALGENIDERVTLDLLPLPSRAGRDVLAERRRQFDVKHYTPEDNDQFTHSELANSAAMYVLCTDGSPLHEHQRFLLKNALEPWASCVFKPKDRRRDLVRAAALIIAEIDRMDRAADAGG